MLHFLHREQYGVLVPHTVWSRWASARARQNGKQTTRRVDRRMPHRLGRLVWQLWPLIWGYLAA